MENEVKTIDTEEFVKSVLLAVNESLIKSNKEKRILDELRQDLDRWIKRVSELETCVKGLNKEVNKLHIEKKEREKGTVEDMLKELEEPLSSNDKVRQTNEFFNYTKFLSMNLLCTKGNIVYSNDSRVQEFQSECMTVLNKFLDKHGL